MRITRLLLILGPAAVLYALAARASSDTAPSPEWLVAASSLALALAPLLLLGARPSRRLSALALMGASMAVAIASGGTSSLPLERVHDLAWLTVSVLVLDLALGANTHRLVRVGAIGGLLAAAGASALLSSESLLPPQTFGVVVVFGILAAAAIHQMVLTARGHSVEGGTAAIAIVCLAVALAYAWFGPFEGLLATTVEVGVALLLWLGHLAWLDERWRSLRRLGVPVIVASIVCFASSYAFAPSRTLERWEAGTLALTAGLVWWVTFTLARRLSRRAMWSRSHQLADAATVARARLVGATNIEAAATAALVPLDEALSNQESRAELWTFEPPLRVRAESGDRVLIRTAEAPEVVTRALMGNEVSSILDLMSLRSRVVREPAVRELVDVMEARGLGAGVPCVHVDHLEGILLLPLAGRTEPLSPVEEDELRRLGQALGINLASTLAQRRAESHIHQISELRHEAEREVAALQGEVEQLRDQCDVLGRGLAEDQTLHVAYSPSMRRVQTRAIELAPGEGPVLLIAASGSPVLPVARFIHDRGPRWSAPFVVADCSATAPEEVMRLLFGSGEGRSAWFDSATGGTLLLRDLPALPRAAQARLAQALGEAEAHSEDDLRKTVPPRIIATSRTGVAALRREGALDPELERRLSPQAMSIPALRERREDVPSLALLAIDRACRVLARDPIGIDQQAMGALVDHDWPGDVAEFELVIELAASRTKGKTIGLADLPPLAWPTGEREESLEGTYLEVERRLLEQALRRAGGNKSQAARRLGLKRTTFLDKLRRHGLEQRGANDVGESALG